MDIRLDTGLFNHHKIKRLTRVAGSQAVNSLLQLWAWAADHRSKGVLYGMDNIDIAEVSGWTEDPDIFVNSLIDCNWIDRDEGDELSLHNWEKRQPWAYFKNERSEKAKIAADARWGARGYAKRNAGSIPDALLKPKSSNAPSPSPNPSPNPNPNPRTKTSPNCPIQKIQDLFNQLCTSLPPINDIEGTRLSHLRARWKKKPDLEFWNQFFVTVEASDFLSGRTSASPGHENWRCGFDWIIKSANFTKIVEGNYVNKPVVERLTEKQKREHEACREALRK